MERLRRYVAAYVSKLSDAEGEAAETQTWLTFAVKCNYLTQEQGQKLHTTYDQVIDKLVRMIYSPDPWIFKRRVSPDSSKDR